MSDPIDYLIVRNLQAALQAIAVEAGYHSTIAALAVKLDPDQAVESYIDPTGPRPFVILELKPEIWEYLPANEAKITWPVTVHWIDASDPSDDASRAKTHLCGCADIEQAIAQDITRGGWAVDTRIIRRAMAHDVTGATVWTIVDLEVRYYRTFGRPNAA